MLKHKITSIIIGTLMLSGVVLCGSAMHNAKITNDNTKVVNKVLLAAPSSTVGERAVVVNTDNNPLVLYSSANANSNITSYISVGEMLTIQSSGNNFYKVKVQETGAVGYISAHNLQIITSGVNDAYNAVNKKGYIINVSSRVNLRANATMNSNILAKLSNNTKINVLGKQGQWYKVNCNGTIGYIYQEYIGLTNTNLENSDNSKSINTSSHTTIKTKSSDTSKISSNVNNNISSKNLNHIANEREKNNNVINKYFGTWVVSKNVGHSIEGINQNAPSLVGEKLQITNNIYSFNGSTIKKPYYYIKTVDCNNLFGGDGATGILQHQLKLNLLIVSSKPLTGSEVKSLPLNNLEPSIILDNSSIYIFGGGKNYSQINSTYKLG